MTDTTTALQPDDLHLIEQIPLFTYAPPELRLRLQKNAIITSFEQSGLLFNHGDPAHNIYVLLNGLVTISLYHEDGTQVIVETINPVRSFAEAAVFLQGRYPATAEYSAGTKILTVPMKNFLEQMEENPKTGFAFLGSLALWERDLRTHLESLKLHNATQRIVHYILDHIDSHIEGSYEFDLQVDKSTLSKILGIQPESLSRLFSRMDVLGVTSTRRTIHIKNVSALRSYHLESLSD